MIVVLLLSLGVQCVTCLAVFRLLDVRREDSVNRDTVSEMWRQLGRAWQRGSGDSGADAVRDWQPCDGADVPECGDGR